MPMSRDLREFVECLNSNKAEYDRWSSRSCVARIPSVSGDITDLTTPGKVIQLGYEPNRIDLMTVNDRGQLRGGAKQE